ncbi:tetratricopeptide repeat protein [Actinomyces sp. MRS3W]|uniref:tetratricopeptide repeat protein n=1 Tax=Actinomyces sp. MRS3W TaxID=2800796 RepID=UPI0028FD511B|nr:tetratricopeptide repeat protein [Actinomyces sp. MRS3W]MDU0348496.1 tetratricopeptide repeat protein [Actinomyces sp. MRS3W]
MADEQVTEQQEEQTGTGAPDRQELAAFLATAPDGLREWADAQLARFDADAPPVSDDAAPGASGDDTVGAAEPGSADPGAAGGAAADDAADVEDLLADEDRDDDRDDAEDPESGQDAAEDSPEAAPAADPGASATAARRGRTPSVLQQRTGVSRLNLVLVALLAAAVVIIIQQAGRNEAGSGTALPSGHPSIAATANATDIAALDEAEPVDAELEADLQAQAETDPANIEARQELGVMYLKAALYQDSITWLQQILDVEPDNLDALLTIGVAEYQSSQYEAAETHWLRATEIDPDVAEPWYNLGFLYLAQTPPDTERARECWDKVLELAPDSEMAAAVRSHEDGTATGSATASAG